MGIRPISNDEWDAMLKEIIDRNPASNLLSIPGVYELVSDDLNNEILKEILEEDNEAQ